MNWVRLTFSAMVTSAAERSSVCFPRPCITSSEITTARAIDRTFSGQYGVKHTGRLQHTIAVAMQTSSKPAPFVNTNLVNKRRKTTVPAMSVNARTIVFTRMPAGKALSSITVGVQIEWSHSTY